MRLHVVPAQNGTLTAYLHNERLLLSTHGHDPEQNGKVAGFPAESREPRFPPLPHSSSSRRHGCVPEIPPPLSAGDFQAPAPLVYQRKQPVCACFIPSILTDCLSLSRSVCCLSLQTRDWFLALDEGPLRRLI